MREFYPFYVTYGSPLLLQGDTIEEQELDRLKEDYPQTARQVQTLVERECDLLDYEGSWLYDEHPDKWSVYRLSRKIRRQLETPQVTAAGGDFLEELIEVLLFHEISRRRCRRRRYFYPGGRF